MYDPAYQNIMHVLPLILYIVKPVFLTKSWPKRYTHGQATCSRKQKCSTTYMYTLYPLQMCSYN